MGKWIEILNKFILQVKSGDLKTVTYPKEWNDLKLRVSFGMGAQARVPWIAFIAPEMQVSSGFYPCYLYYREDSILILSYGVSETSEYAQTWPVEIMNSTATIKAFFDKNVPRYGDSFVFKAYRVNIEGEQVRYQTCDNGGKEVTETDVESHLQTILDYYKNAASIEIRKDDSPVNQGLFYLEEQLEDFLIHNWERTELGKQFELIVVEGELLSRQYRTDIGKIDILAKDKKTGSHVVIELKKKQTSDDTVGQVTRYMGWIKKNKKDNNVKGIIIAAEPDKRLECALSVVPNVELFLYQVDFNLTKFKEE